MDGLILRSSCSYYGTSFLLCLFVYVCETYHTFYWMLWVLFAAIPVIDYFLPPSLSNPTPEEEKTIKNQKRFHIPIYLFLFLSWVTFFWGLGYLYRTEMTYFEFISFTYTFGMIGVLSVLHGHELTHKKEKIARFIVGIDLVKTLYMHIYSEHVKGHHRWVSTPLDKGTGKYGQTFYEFFPQSFLGSYTCTWKREVQRLQKLGRSKYSPYNKMFIWALCEILFTYTIYHFYGARVLLFFVLQAAVTIVSLEEFNYFTHYGLTRKKLENGEYEPVKPNHSWSAHQLIQNVIELGVQRHPDHHSFGHRPYQILRAFDDGPTLPCGYLTCIIVSLFPPVWFRITHPIIEGINKDGKPNDQQKNQSKNVFFIWMVIQAGFTSIAPFLF